MNEESWKKTPDTLKPVIDDVCHNPFKTTGGLTRDVYKKMMQEVTDKKVELYNLPDNEAERWYDRFRDVTRKWVEDLEAKGLKAKEVVKMYNRRRVRKKRRKSRGIPEGVEVGRLRLRACSTTPSPLPPHLASPPSRGRGILGCRTVS